MKLVSSSIGYCSDLKGEGGWRCATLPATFCLSYDTNESVLKEVYGHYGEIIEAKVICGHKSGKSKGYGFVHFIYKDSASKALAEMDGQVLGGRNIRIQYVNKKEGWCNLNLENLSI
ncbi:putative RNA recognition motif domain, nucleotide-binding alpha-beta plait domain superfamily [Helianthus annuus]|nr:putative RNA recognition motif domain, nucleotide-binding alpha-beta plait domain superfamily [Helianthus annuus]